MEGNHPKKDKKIRKGKDKAKNLEKTNFRKGGRTGKKENVCDRIGDKTWKKRKRT